jgi:prepilin-type N-terminal cleavage/methylation domain-containing protein
VRIFRQDNRGFTLIEVMVAMGITLVALLGLLQAVSVVSEQNLQNMQRDEAVQVAEAQMNLFRVLPFGQIVTCPACTGSLYTYPVTTAPSRLRGGAGTYQVTRTTVVSNDGTQINTGVNVQWTYKGKVTSHEVHSIRSN